MSLHRLLFDPSNAAESANVGAYLRSSDGTLLTHTTVGADEALDINLVQSVALTVQATDLDIRDLTAASDSVASHLHDGAGTALTSTLVGADQALDVNVVALTAADVDIRDLSASQDNVAISDGTDTLAVNGDGSINVVASATDLDIRDLTHTTDSVRIGDGTDLVTITDVDASHKALDVNIAASDIEINVEDDKANTAIASASETVTTTSGALNTSDLANRRFIWIYNHGNKEVFIGPSGVTTGDGFPVFPGGLLEARIGPSVAVHAVAASGSQDIRVLQAS